MGVWFNYLQSVVVQTFNIYIQNKPTAVFTLRDLGLITGIFLLFLFLFPIFIHLLTYTPLRLFQSSSSLWKCSLQGIKFYIFAPFPRFTSPWKVFDTRQCRWHLCREQSVLRNIFSDILTAATSVVFINSSTNALKFCWNEK